MARWRFFQKTMGADPGGLQLIEDLLVPEGIHALPEARIALRPNFALDNHSLKRLVD